MTTSITESFRGQKRPFQSRLVKVAYIGPAESVMHVGLYSEVPKLITTI